MIDMPLKKPMKKFLIAMFLAVTGFIVYDVMIYCPSCLTAEEKAFSTKIKNAILTKGDVIKLRDIYLSEWQKVCLRLSDSNVDLRDGGKNQPKRLIANNVHPYFTMPDYTALEFIYGVSDDGYNYIEVFRANPNELRYVVDAEKGGCFDNKQAYLIVYNKEETEKGAVAPLRLLLTSKAE